MSFNPLSTRHYFSLRTGGAQSHYGTVSIRFQRGITSHTSRVKAHGFFSEFQSAFNAALLLTAVAYDLLYEAVEFQSAFNAALLLTVYSDRGEVYNSFNPLSTRHYFSHARQVPAVGTV